MTAFHFQKTQTALILFRDGDKVAEAEVRPDGYKYGCCIDRETYTKRQMKRDFSRRYINVYCVTREYGGPEEGGWWYNAYHYVKGYKYTTPQDAEADLDRITKEWSGESSGNINSVLGGELYVAYLENRYAESATKERPYYC